MVQTRNNTLWLTNAQISSNTDTNTHPPDTMALFSTRAVDTGTFTNVCKNKKTNHKTLIQNQNHNRNHTKSAHRSRKNHLQTKTNVAATDCTKHTADKQPVVFIHCPLACLLTPSGITRAVTHVDNHTHLQNNTVQ
jgi:hypothetical protein